MSGVAGASGAAVVVVAEAAQLASYKPFSS